MDVLYTKLKDKPMRIFASTPLLLTVKEYLTNECGKLGEQHLNNLESLGKKVTLVKTVPGNIEYDLMSGISGKYLDVEVDNDSYKFDYKFILIFACEETEPVVIEEKIPVKLKRVSRMQRS